MTYKDITLKICLALLCLQPTLNTYTQPSDFESSSISNQSAGKLLILCRAIPSKPEQWLAKKRKVIEQQQNLQSTTRKKRRRAPNYYKKAIEIAMNRTWTKKK